MWNENRAFQSKHVVAQIFAGMRHYRGSGASFQ
jgi:hypothetical protein